MILKRSVAVRRLQTQAPMLFMAALLLYGLWPWLPFPGRGAAPDTIVFYGFSILGEVMNKAIFPAFRKEWRERTGRQVEFISAFAGSGTVRNQILMGVPAHLALLSLELDAYQLAEGHVIAADSWRSLPYHGVVNRTPFVVLVRPRNPQQIRDFQDLARPGTKIVHPDPLTSGGANWAIVAEYGAGARRSGAPSDAGRNLLLGIWKNVVAQAGSARAARTQFENGFGDALITYEQELLVDKARAKLKGEIVYPSSTILSEHTLVLVPKNIRPAERAVVDAFAKFLWSEPAQRLFVQHGFRSVEESINAGHEEFGQIPDLFSIADFGGWIQAKKQVVDGVWKQQVLKQLKR